MAESPLTQLAADLWVKTTPFRGLGVRMTVIRLPGLAEKRSDLNFHETLGDSPPAAWSGVMEQLVTTGLPKLNEVVCFHRAGRTLLLTDLAFNYGRGGPPLLRLLLRLNGAYGKFGPTRISKLFFLVNKGQLVETLARIRKWPFDRIVVGHGDVLETGGQDEFQRAFAEFA